MCIIISTYIWHSCCVEIVYNFWYTWMHCCVANLCITLGTYEGIFVLHIFGTYGYVLLCCRFVYNFDFFFWYIWISCCVILSAYNFLNVFGTYEWVVVLEMVYDFWKFSWYIWMSYWVGDFVYNFRMFLVHTEELLCWRLCVIFGICFWYI